ncbi:hypothetical protein BRETT_005286 [Brettanomyces bruxellensis]|uniref:Uncharacterized protein n=1 Tax=Dekkera bruxellensis TaxID=5007 RepID=A0A871R144_DEKBR|nr:uncharacterized protein BRETT_005286 [Brettanomyces bruxellensis]QOU18224.1 hypothetical protein BRETT_005286 [Brettanomyces bruxellensis]
MLGESRRSSKRVILENQVKDDPIVLKIGCRFIEIGVSGQDASGLRISSSKYAQKQLFKVNAGSHHAINVNNLQENTVLTIEEQTDLVWFRYLFYPDILIYENRGKNVGGFQYALEGHLIHLFNDIFKNAKADYVNAKIYMLTDQFANDSYMKTVLYILLKKMHARSVVLVPTAVMCCIGAGVMDGLVVDFGWNHVNVVPVYDGRVLSNYASYTDRAGRMVHYRLISELRSKKVVENSTFEEIESLIEGIEEVMGNDGARKGQNDKDNDEKKNEDGNVEITHEDKNKGGDKENNETVDESSGKEQINKDENKDDRGNGDSSTHNGEKDAISVDAESDITKEESEKEESKKKDAVKREIEMEGTDEMENGEKSQEAENATKEVIKHVLKECLLPSENGWINLDSQEKAPVDLAVNTILDLPIDIRKRTASHVILTGGLMEISWLRTMFKESLVKVLKGKNSKLDVETIQTLGGWAGASIFASVIAPEQGVNNQIQEFRRD